MNYFDTSYLVRLYFEEAGWEAVRELKTNHPWACSLHGRAEVIAAFHRKYREGAIDGNGLGQIISQFEFDCQAGEFDWLPITDSTVSALAGHYKKLPATSFLRAADALHLASAREHGFKTIFSNDKALLDAAKHFGLRGKNVVAVRGPISPSTSSRRRVVRID